ncbi:MAG: MmgE/PrpD family protein [Candidatus Rokubacteria bacterium]|nr:MmgE/PrpD family protein [Candidatus Rokubacteria bacterium]
MRGLTRRLSAMLVGTRFEDLSRHAGDAVKRSILDTLGCGLAGAGVAECDLLMESLTPMGSAPVATVVGRRLRLASPFAAMVNATAARALDMDDLFEPGQTHASVAVVPTALAVAEMLDRPLSGREFMTATTVAVDLLARLSMAPHRDSNETGLSHNYHCGVFASAAAAARLLGCDERAMQSALGLALGMAGGTRQPNLEGVPAVRVQQGWAAHAGVMAGILAWRGVGGPAEVFEGHYGYFNVYHRGEYAPERLVAGLGERFAVEDLTVKFYPACKYAYGAVEAILSLQRQRVFDSTSVRRVHVRVPGASYVAVCQPEDRKRAPASAPEALFSLPYLTAAALVRGRLTPAELTPAALADPQVLDWARRIEVERDDGLAIPPDALSSAVVQVELTSGERVEERIIRTVGDPRRPPRYDEIEEKVRVLVDGAGGRDVADVKTLAGTVAALDELPDVRELAGLLRGR